MRTDLKMWKSIAQQRVRENQWVVHLGLVLLMVWGYAQALLGRRRRAIDALSQVHRTTRWTAIRKLVEPYVVAHRDAVFSEPRFMREPDLQSFFGNRLMVLKPPAPGRQKGVLFAMASVMFPLLHSNMNLPRLLAEYTLVFEPSWSGYCHPDILEYTRWNQDVFVLSAEENDFAFLKNLDSNLIPVGLGPCDWVDPCAAEPYLANPKEFDIVMNSNWGAWKRHYVLFQMLRSAKQPYTVALIGFKWSGRSREDIERLANYYGVASQLAIFEDIPYQQVMDLACRSRVSVLLSLKEGSNRAIAESIFCNVPVVLLADHVGGIRKNVVPETGLLVEERHLESAINTLIQSRIAPREWGLQHVSCQKSTEILNAILREASLKRGSPWTQDIVVRSNSPESKYVDLRDAERLAPWNQGLRDYLR